MIVSTPREPLWAWLNTRVPVPWSEDFRAIGAVHDGCLKAVTAYNVHVGRTCMMHTAIDDPIMMTREYYRAVFEYPFDQLKVLYVMAVVDERNDKAMSLDLRLGFKEVHRLPNASLLGGDLVVLQMSRSECRMLKENRHGR